MGNHYEYAEWAEKDPKTDSLVFVKFNPINSYSAFYYVGQITNFSIKAEKQHIVSNSTDSQEKCAVDSDSQM